MTEISTMAQLRHINLRKEGPDDSKEPAFDLKLEAVVPGQLVDQLLCGDDELKGAAITAFWNEDGTPRFWNLGRIGFARQIEHAEAVIEGITIHDARVSKFEFCPREKHEATLVFSVSAKDWPSNALAVFAEMLHDVVKVHITTPQGDLFQKDTNDTNATAEAAAE